VIWVAVALGGAVGSMLRHAVNVAIHRATGQTVPTAVAAVNISGCLVIGVLAGLIAAGRWSPSPAMRVFVFVGLLGGFTTFSSFGLDTLALAREGRPLLAAVNVLGQVTAGLLAVFLGYAVASR
jgi:fluoride exporter